MRQPIRVSAPPAPQPDLLRAAFRDLHAARLHGFAMLVALGDRERAGAATRTALAEGSRRIDQLRHPERAAAWLRARALRSLRRPSWRRRPSDQQRLAALLPMGVDGRLFAALAELSIAERAAVVARLVEGLQPDDVAIVLGRSPGRARRDAARAIGRYLAAVTAQPAATASGPLSERVREVAARAFAPSGSR